MAKRISSNLIWNGYSLAGSSANTATAIDISSSDALALHLTAISGTTPSVTFTYSLSATSDYVAGPFTVPQSPVTIGATKSAIDVMDFAPEVGGAIKIIATNNGTGTVVLTAYLVSQESSAS